MLFSEMEVWILRMRTIVHNSSPVHKRRHQQESGLLMRVDVHKSQRNDLVHGLLSLCISSTHPAAR